MLMSSGALSFLCLCNMCMFQLINFEYLVIIISNLFCNKFASCYSFNPCFSSGITFFSISPPVLPCVPCLHCLSFVLQIVHFWHTQRWQYHYVSGSVWSLSSHWNNKTQSVGPHRQSYTQPLYLILLYIASWSRKLFISTNLNNYVSNRFKDCEHLVLSPTHLHYLYHSMD